MNDFERKFYEAGVLDAREAGHITFAAKSKRFEELARELHPQVVDSRGDPVKAYSDGVANEINHQLKSEANLDGSLSVFNLSRDQLVELKQNMLVQRDTGEGVSWSELADADSLISDEEVFEEFEGTSFSPDDFSCSVQFPSLSDRLESASSKSAANRATHSVKSLDAARGQ